jgi:hypothetical protein
MWFECAHCIVYIVLTTKNYNKNIKIDGNQKVPSKIQSSKNQWYKDIKTSKDLRPVYEHADFPVDYCPHCSLQEKHCYCVFEPHSGNIDANVMKVTANAKSQNVSFADQHDPYMYDMEGSVDPTRRLQDSDDATLDSFFSRPIKIFEQDWGTSTTFYESFNPWSLYFENPRVINRITNYNLLRANLKIKIVINGNGFQYGRLIASYLPFDALDTFSSNAALVPQDVVQASQQPRLFLDPTTSSGGEMTLPFFWYFNYMSIPTSDWSLMGDMYIRSINELKHANGAVDKVTVSVFAWAEDVSFSVLTSVDSDALTPQSGAEIDEANSTGVVSGPATSVAKLANSLAAIPSLAPFAMATSTIASGISSLAKLLGYCRPPVTKNPEPYRAFPTSSFALTNVPDHAQKLTVDEKQELTIDPRIAGLGGADVLNMKGIAARESYLTTFDWNINTAPETLLWNTRISPVTWAESTTSTATAIHLPACAMAAMPFRHWTGTMKFRFQIVCSAFHKGRLKFVYDPNYLDSNEYNTNYIQIIDIADTQDFTIEIGNGQDVSLLTRAYPGLDGVSEMYSTTAYNTKGPGNGVLGVYVVNELTTPNSTVDNDIQVNVFVSMGDDFEVFVPINDFQNFVFRPPPPPALEAQSGVDTTGSTTVVADAQNTSEMNAPIQDQSISLGPGVQDTADINKVFTGESITSFRTMLKRYQLHTAIGADSSTPAYMSGSRNLYPYFRGYITDAADRTISGDPYNYCNTVMFHWVDQCFSGRRGGMRYKIVPRGGDTAPSFTGCIERYNNETSNGAVWSRVTGPIPAYANAFAIAASTVLPGNSITPANDQPLTGTQGMVYVNSKVNPTAEFEVPYQTFYRFQPGKPEARQSNSTLQGNAWWYRYFISDVIAGQAASTSVFDIYTAAAEDYTPYFWTGMPPVYREVNTPEPQE